MAEETNNSNKEKERTYGDELQALGVKLAKKVMIATAMFLILGPAGVALYGVILFAKQAWKKLKGKEDKVAKEISKKEETSNAELAEIKQELKNTQDMLHNMIAENRQTTALESVDSSQESVVLQREPQEDPILGMDIGVPLSEEEITINNVLEEQFLGTNEDRTALNHDGVIGNEIDKDLFAKLLHELDKDIEVLPEQHTRSLPTNIDSGSSDGSQDIGEPDETKSLPADFKVNYDLMKTPLNKEQSKGIPSKNRVGQGATKERKNKKGNSL